MFVFGIFRFANRPLCRALRTGLALCLVLTAITATAGTTDGIHLLNDGKPVQVTVSKPTRDLNHLEDFSLQRLPERAATESSGAGTRSTAVPPLLQFPVRRGFTNDHPGIHSISNYVDLDPVHPDKLLDYNCGDRTYDTDTFDHNGIDISPAMFGWLTMDTDGYIVIAAADGTIIERHDGEPDRQCAFGDDVRANLIVLQHDDGSVTIYAHMKNGTVTPRSVGDRVEAGDYLGVVGSSGLSTGPHLHLGVQDSGDNLIEPYAGACNGLNDSSWWAQQEDYHVKTINAARTHSAAPVTPACPDPEVPNFQDEFMPGDTVFLSAFVRDFVKEDTVDIVIRGPSNQVLVQTSYEQSEFDHASALSVVFSVQFPQGVEIGAYILAVTYAGKSLEHTFYINSGPDPLPEAVEANNAFNGAWYDPLLDGEGYNIVTTGSGTGVYFYGSDVNGNRLWLISDLLPGPIFTGVEIEINMYESTGGVFSSPVTSARGLSLWGTVVFVFSDCESGVATLTGVDGVKVSQIVKITGAAGTACNPGDIPADSAWSGVWFDFGKDGEGYNLIIAPPGRIMFFYGFKSSGLRLWLISELFSTPLQVGVDVSFDMFEAAQGDFDNPVPSIDALVKWGTATITLVDCTHVKIVMTGLDGSKTSNTVLLAGTIGLVCS